MPVLTLRTTFSHVSASGPTFDRSSVSSARPAIFARSLWQVMQYLLRANAASGTAVVAAAGACGGCAFNCCVPPHTKASAATHMNVASGEDSERGFVSDASWFRGRSADDALDAKLFEQRDRARLRTRGMRGEEHAFRPRQRRAAFLVLHVELRRPARTRNAMMSSEPRLAAPCSAVSPIELTALTSMPELEAQLHGLEQRRLSFVERLIERPSSRPRPPSAPSSRRTSRCSDRRRASAAAASRSTSPASAAVRNGVCPVKSTHASDPVMRRNVAPDRRHFLHARRSRRRRGRAAPESARGYGARSMLLTNVALSTSMLRVSTAAHSGVRPYQSAALMSAPFSIRNRATSGWLLVIAHDERRDAVGVALR